MEAPDPDAAVKTSHWHSRGTYYVEAPEKKRYHRWACYVCLFLLITLMFAAIITAIMYDRSQGNKKRNPSFLEEFHDRCGLNGSWTEDELSSYRKYFETFKGKNVSEVCTGFQCYLESQNTIEKYNNQTEKGVSHFGNTIFSDWCANRRHAYVHPIRTSSAAIKVNVTDNTALHFTRSDGIAPKIVFNDGLAFNDTVKFALLQWMYYANDSLATRSMFPNWETFVKNVSNDYGLYDIAKPLKAVEEDDFHKSYLIQEGVFATEVYLNDLAFFYQDGVLPRKVCDATYYDEVKFPVIVLGYGIDGNSTPYWEVQPIGEQFKVWGRNGTMRIHDTCYKKKNAPRIIDIDLKSRQESTGNEDIPIGKFATLPLA